MFPAASLSLAWLGMHSSSSTIEISIALTFSLFWIGKRFWLWREGGSLICCWYYSLWGSFELLNSLAVYLVGSFFSSNSGNNYFIGGFLSSISGSLSSGSYESFAWFGSSCRWLAVNLIALMLYRVSSSSLEGSRLIKMRR